MNVTPISPAFSEIVDTPTNKISKPRSGKSKNSSRSRFGCSQCRSQRAKCDEIKPKCSRCTSKNIGCTYQMTLQYREDFENKGKKFGREGVWGKMGNKKTVSELIKKSHNSYYLDIENKNNLMFINFSYHEFKEPAMILRPSIRPSIFPPEIKSLGDYDRSSLSFALSYYIEFISPILNPVDNIQDSLLASRYLPDHHIVIEKGLNLSSLIQYAQYNPHLFFLILSLGSIYLSKISPGSYNEEWFDKSYLFKLKGLSMIGGVIDYINDPSRHNKHKSYRLDTSLLLSLVLLIMDEVADDCNEKWVFYLKTCKKLVFSPEFIQPKSQLEDSLLRFAIDFLNYQECMGRTACRQENSFFDSLKTLDDEPVDNLVPKSLISWMGCDKKLINVISDITDLSLERSNRGITENNYQILCNAMKQKLDAMDLKIKADDILFDIAYDFNRNFKEVSQVAKSELIILADDIHPEEFCFILACEVKRACTSIYLDCCLLNKTPEDEGIKTQVKQLYKYLKFIILNNDFRWCSTLLWSLFIVSSSISVHDEECEDLRYLTLSLLDKLEKNSLGNVNQTRDIISSIWKARDLQNCDEHSFGKLRKSEISNPRHKKSHCTTYLGPTNDWEHFVANESYRISLA